MKKISYVSLFVLFLLIILSITTSAETGIVNCDLLNVRVSPNTSSNVVTQVKCGTRLEIVYTDIGWYNVRMADGVTGFVSAPYLTLTNSTVANSIPANVANNAYSYLGYRYVYGAEGPDAFDCSGFVYYLYKQQGVSLYRTADDQADYCGFYVDKSALVPGDLVFFSNRSDRSINHVGIYVGDGNFIHASTSTRGVVMDSLYSNYYTKSYVTARRIM